MIGNLMIMNHEFTDESPTLDQILEEVRRIAKRVEDLTPIGGGATMFFVDQQPPEQIRTLRPSLPDPRLVRQMIRNRQTRAKYFDAEIFSEPAWNMMLDLTAARAEHSRVSVTSLCIASGVPPTTALRWINAMVEAGLFDRKEDVVDRRRAFIALSDMAAEAMARFFQEIGGASAPMI